MTQHHPVRAETQPGRRTFLQRLWLWTTIATGVVATVFLAIPVVGFFFGAALRKPPKKWVNLGPIGKFPEGETMRVTFDNPIRQPWDGQVAETAVFVRYEGLGEDKKHRFLVLAVNCAHLGCGVSWFAQSGLFMCPCHGGVYYSTGERASGPPPRGLYPYVWEVRDGELHIQAPHYPTLQNTLRHPA
jgi:menaquinol-cytochrome c reductase iron-sulfur subunit